MNPGEQAERLRDRYKKQTSRAIVAAFIEAMEDSGSDRVPVPELAARAGVSERTVHRHFPSRVDLLAAASDHINTELFEYVAAPSLAELPAVYRTVVEHYEQRPALAYVLAMSRLGRGMRSGFRSDLVLRLGALIDQEAPALDAATRRKALASLTYLDNVLAWTTLRDEMAMDGDEIAETVGWMMNLVLGAITEPAGSGRASDAAGSPS